MAIRIGANVEQSSKRFLSHVDNDVGWTIHGLFRQFAGSRHKSTRFGQSYFTQEQSFGRYCKARPIINETLVNGSQRRKAPSLHRQIDVC